MRVIDTSALYAFFKQDDEHHAAALREMNKEVPTLIDNGTLQETLDLIRYRHGKDAAIKALDYLEGLPTIHFMDTTERGPIRTLWRNHKALSMADAAGAWLAYIEGADLLTFDEEQAAALESLRSA